MYMDSSADRPYRRNLEIRTQCERVRKENEGYPLDSVSCHPLFDFPFSKNRYLLRVHYTPQLFQTALPTRHPLSVVVEDS